MTDGAITIEEIVDLLRQRQGSLVHREFERMKAQKPVDRRLLVAILDAALARSEVGLASDISTYLLASNPTGVEEFIYSLDVRSRSKNHVDRITVLDKLRHLDHRSVSADRYLHLSSILQRLCMVKMARQALKRAGRLGADRFKVGVRQMELLAFNKKLKERQPFKGSEKLAVWIPGFMVRRQLDALVRSPAQPDCDYTHLTTAAELLGYPGHALAFARKHDETKSTLGSRVFLWIRLARAGQAAEAFRMLALELDAIKRSYKDDHLVRGAAEIAARAGQPTLELELLSGLAQHHPENAGLQDALAAAAWANRSPPA